MAFHFFRSISSFDIFQQPLPFNFEDGLAVRNDQGNYDIRTYATALGKLHPIPQEDAASSQNDREGGEYAQVMKSKRELEKKERIGWKSQILFGGILSFLVCSAVLGYVSYDTDRVQRQRENIFASLFVSYNAEEMANHNVTFGAMNNSLNFVFGLTNLPDGFDIMNNPYVEFLGHEASDNGGGYWDLRNIYDLDLCDQEHIDRFVLPHKQMKYQQNLCFQDRNRVKMHQNDYLPGFHYPTINIAYCMNRTSNDNWCKPLDEIDDWLSSIPAYFVYQKTYVQHNIWEDHEIVDDHPYFGDEDAYFPTVKSMESYNYGPIVVDTSKRDTFFQFNEITFQLEDITIDDSHWRNGTRSTEIVNVYKTREGKPSLRSRTFPEGEEHRHLIRTIKLFMGEVGKSHMREVTSMVDQLAAFGGIVTIFFYMALFTYIVLGGPFAELNFSLGTAELMTRVAKQRHLSLEQQVKTTNYKDSMGLCFYFKWFLYNLIPSALHTECCFGREEEPEDYEPGVEPKFQQMVYHFKELNDQARYFLSLRNLAQLTMQSQLLDDSVEKIAQNTETAAGNKMAIEQHWAKDGDKMGAFNQEPVTVMHMESVPDTGRAMLPQTDRQQNAVELKTDFGPSAVELTDQPPAQDHFRKQPTTKLSTDALTLQDIEAFVEEKVQKIQRGGPQIKVYDPAVHMMNKGPASFAAPSNIGEGGEQEWRSMVGQVSNKRPASLFGSLVGEEELAMIDQIWNKYDGDRTGALYKHEAKRLLQDQLGDQIEDDQKFDMLFQSHDVTGSGSLDKENMCKLLKASRMLLCNQ